MEQIDNWTQASQMDVAWNKPHGLVPSLVTLSIDAGPLRMHFSMTAQKAREMAKTLAAYADEVDACSTACEVAA